MLTHLVQQLSDAPTACKDICKKNSCVLCGVVYIYEWGSTLNAPFRRSRRHLGRQKRKQWNYVLGNWQVGQTQWGKQCI